MTAVATPNTPAAASWRRVQPRHARATSPAGRGRRRSPGTRPRPGARPRRTPRPAIVAPDVLGDRRQDEQRLGRARVEYRDRVGASAPAPAVVATASRTARGRRGRSPARAAGTGTSRRAGSRSGRRVYAAYSSRISIGVPAAIASELSLARALHRDEPERRLVDRLADREQAVVLVDRGLAGRERGGELLAGFDLEHDGAALLGDHGVVVVEDAGVLGERGERDAERAERLAVDRVRVGGGDDSGRAWWIAEWITNAARLTGSSRTRRRRCG